IEQLPSLKEFFLNRHHANKKFKDIFYFLIEFIFDSDSFAKSDFENIIELIDTLFSLGLENSERKNILNNISNIWLKYQSAKTLQWLLDITDLIVLNCPSAKEEIEKFFNLIVGGFSSSWNKRIEEEQWETFGFLAEDLDKSLEFDEIQEQIKPKTEVDEESLEDPFLKLKGKYIGIYTLTDSVGRSCENYLKKKIPDIRVNVRSDKSASPELISMSKESDLLIFFWLSSKHQAYYCIEQNRPKDKPIVQPKGRGRGSMIEALKTHLS
ncbi:hypothetical protein ACFL35_18635, partial [Candidatus Riflebacteria bacterium]